MHTTAIFPNQSPPKDGRLHSVKGYTGIKIRFLKQSIIANDYSYYIYYRVGGRQGKQVLQKVGTKSQGMTPKKPRKSDCGKFWSMSNPFMAVPSMPLIPERLKTRRPLPEFGGNMKSKNSRSARLLQLNIVISI